MPSPPSYDPAAIAVPASAPPVSGAYGYPMMPMPVQPRRNRGGMVVLGVLAAIFLVAGGVLGTLYYFNYREGQDLSAQVASLSAENAAQREELESAQRRAENLQRDLTDTEELLAEITDQKDAIGACLNAFVDLNEALFDSGGEVTTEVQNLEDEFFSKCDEADRYLAVRR